MIYLDHAATTPVLPSAYEKMKPWLDGSMIGNPSSIHSAGKQAHMAVEDAREKVAKLIGAKPEEIIFTSGGTESDNLALQGVASSAHDGLWVFLSSGIEHHAILNQEALLRKKYGTALIQVKTMSDGTVDLEDLQLCLRIYGPELVSIMLANNETGVIQPMQEIAQLCERYGTLLHTDAVQAVGHIPVDVNRLGVDMLSLSGHKFGAPDGIGALYIRKEIQAGFHPVICGGGQEHGIRAGTENVAAIVGFGAAAEWALESMASEEIAYCGHRDAFVRAINAELGEEVRINGGGLQNILNITIPGVQSEALLLMMDANDVCISAASACSAGSPQPSHVLTAMGISGEDANCTVRISFGHTTTRNEVVKAAWLLAKNAKRIRSMYR